MWAISASKLLPVTLLANNSPLVHHEPSHGDEKCGGCAASDHQDTDPSNDLKEVVWARNPVESESLWNSTSGGSSWTEVAEHNVGVQVGELAIDVCGKTSPDEVLCVV